MCAPMHGQTAEVYSWLRAGVQAQQLRAAQAQYKETREQLKRGLQAAEAALLRGVAPSTLALQPALRLPFVPSVGTGAGAGGAAVSRLLYQACRMGISETDLLLTFWGHQSSACIKVALVFARVTSSLVT